MKASPIKHFHKMARKLGTDLKTALTNFVGIEQKLRKDPIAGSRPDHLQPQFDRPADRKTD